MAEAGLLYSPHARERMAERGVSEAEVEAVVDFPAIDQPGHDGRRRRLDGFDGLVVVLSEDRRVVLTVLRDHEEP